MANPLQFLKSTKVFTESSHTEQWNVLFRKSISILESTKIYPPSGEDKCFEALAVLMEPLNFFSEAVRGLDTSVFAGSSTFIFEEMESCRCSAFSFCFQASVLILAILLAGSFFSLGIFTVIAEQQIISLNV